MKDTCSKIILLLFTILFIASCKKDDSTQDESDLRAENRKSLGTSAEDLLSDDLYNKLTVEFVFSEAFRPTETALINFRSFISERLNKPGGIDFVEKIVPLETDTSFTIDEIRAIEDKHRSIYTNGNNISVYIYFANGKSSNDTNSTVTLGTAYMNTSIVIYEKTLQDLANSSPLINLSDVETTALNHEFGHILGLVNLRDDDIHTNHEDIAHNKHCVVETCLMYFESNNLRGIMQRFAGAESVSDLDPLCIADLRAKGGK